jgi:glycosyltransferase involved in cell wall biosynthesis
MILSIAIPLYNEENYILSVLKKIEAVKFPEFLISVEVIIVDDCSKDNSNSIVKKYIENYSGNINYRLLKHDVNKGKGAAVKTAFSSATGNTYLVQDADSELSPDDIPSMLIAMHELNIDFINGSRYMSGVIRPLYSFGRYAGNRFFSILTSLLINVKISDMACGYKLIRKSLYEKIELKENRFGFEAELIIKAIKIKKNNIAEVPVRYFSRNSNEGKKLKNFDAVKILFKIIKYAFFYKVKKINN